MLMLMCFWGSLFKGLGKGLRVSGLRIRDLGFRAEGFEIGFGAWMG